MQEYADRLLGQLDGQTRIADRVFSSPKQAIISFTKQILNTVLFDYTTQLIDRTRQGNDTEIYLKAVVGSYHQCSRLTTYLNKPRDAGDDFRLRISALVDTLFEPHL